MTYVTLLAPDGTPIGTAEKSTVHHAETPLHLAFSCYLMDDAGRVLVTRRALSKRTWPGVWTNSFCGHPTPEERMHDAVERRALEELGVGLSDLRTVLPDFRYRAVDAAGVVENEVCPVHVAAVVGTPSPDPSEVVETAWTSWSDLDDAVRAAPYAFSPWLREQLPALRSALSTAAAG